MSSMLIVMRLTLLLGCVFMVMGCRYIVSEPYPAFSHSTIAIENVPRVVLEAFVTKRPGAHIDRVEIAAFKKKIVQYRILFHFDSGKGDSVVFDPEGRSVESPGLFKPPSAINQVRQPTLGVYLGANPTPLAQRGCALR